MQYYLLMILATLVIVILTFFIWTKTRSLSFLIGIGIIYYYSLFGAWFIIHDELTGTYDKYQYLYQKMFYVLLDNNYFIALVLYFLFIIIIEIILLLFVKPFKGKEKQIIAPLYVRHTIILLISASALFFSYFLIRDNIYNVIMLSRSLYISRADWQQTVPFFTISLELNQVSLIAAVMGLAVFLSGKNARFIVGVERWWVGLGYLVIITCLIFYNFLLGARGNLMVQGLAFVLFFLVNSGRTKVATRSILGSLLVGLILYIGITGLVRGTPVKELSSSVMEDLNVLNDEEGFDQSILGYVLFSAERVATHFSLYGALSFEVPFTYGSSFISLGASVVPRVLWPDRPDDIYVHYADSVGATPDQGYTIHHATGWYLNFGIPGLVIGAISFSMLWVFVYNLHQDWQVRRSAFAKLFAILAPWTFVGNFPPILRGGIEGYKGLLINAFLVPALIFFTALYRKPVRKKGAENSGMNLTAPGGSPGR